MTRQRFSEVAAQLAAELDGHFLDQFTYAERATDRRGNNNIAEATLAQMALEPHPICRGLSSARRGPDAGESPMAAMRFLTNRLGISAGPSTGTRCLRAPWLACEMCADHAVGSIVTLMCDSGARYTTIYDDDAWLKELSPYLSVVGRAWDDKV